RHGLNLLRQLTRPHTAPDQPLARKILNLLDVFSRHGLNLLRQLTRPHTAPDQPLARKILNLLDVFSRYLARGQPTKIVG
ncbi:hypothetical protein, partial [Hymenobacter rubripertinctus]|uniref:hypothetical protein n=1 Tax=Hymenobacter rubripertinctus TaxID=2029981 RepID=UPI001C71E0EF